MAQAVRIVPHNAISLRFALGVKGACIERWYQCGAGKQTLVGGGLWRRLMAADRPNAVAVAATNIERRLAWLYLRSATEPYRLADHARVRPRRTRHSQTETAPSMGLAVRDMTPLPFGQTGLLVTRVGFGAMHFDGIDDEAEIGRLLNGVLDLGVNLIDTARGYGRSEERIGRHLRHRRHELVLSTKFGYGVEGVADWTYPCIVQGVERALRQLQTDFIDIGHLHSCPLHVLQRGEVCEALADCVKAGKLRVAAYSGENAELAYALLDARFSSVQCSLSLVDPANKAQIAHTAKGVLAKRTLAGLAWARHQRPDDFCEGQYWDRWQELHLPDLGLPWPELALRWTAFTPGISSVLIGTRSLARLREGIEAVERGPLQGETLLALQVAHAQAGADRWPGLI